MPQIHDTIQICFFYTGNFWYTPGGSSVKCCSYQVRPWGVWTWSLSICKSWAGKLLGKSQCLSHKTEKTKLPPATETLSIIATQVFRSNTQPTISRGLWQLWLNISIYMRPEDNNWWWSCWAGLPLHAVCTVDPRGAWLWQIWKPIRCTSMSRCDTTHIEKWQSSLQYKQSWGTCHLNNH